MAHEQDVPVVSHDGAAEQEERHVARRADREQPFLLLEPPESVADHEERDAHRDVREVERKRIA